MEVNKVSIVMPMLDAMPYLSECLDSIVHQSHQHWELIMVDDGSTDESGAVAEEYAAKDNRIHCLTNNGRGIIDALRLAYEHSSGNLITRMDADDIMYPDKLQILSNNLMIHGEGHLAVGAVRYFSDGRLGDGYRKYENWLNNLTRDGSNFDEIYKECVIPSPCWMVHRIDFEQLGAFDSDVYPEDYDLAFRMYQTDLEVIPCDIPLHHWRDYSTRSSRTDPNYLDNRFIELKCHHFLLHDYDATRPLVVWGTGKKGKSIIQQLQQKWIQDLHWITDNDKKIGHNIYELIVKPTSIITNLDLPQIIIAVANEEEQSVIRERLDRMGYCSMIDYFFFC